MSAFIRRQPVRTVDLGTRPGLHGQVLISSGLAGMDKLLGGGLPLGSIMLIIEDSNSQQHNNLLKCFMAEGICCKHTSAWVNAEALSPEAVAAFLPSTAKPHGADSQQQVGIPQSSSSSVQGTAAGTGASAGRQAAEPEDGLKIAWQYRKYIQRAESTPSAPQHPAARTGHSSSSSGSSTFSRTASSNSGSSAGSSSSSSNTAAKNVAAGIGKEWCHQYDLSKGMTPAQLQGSKFETYCCGCQDGSAVAAAGAAAISFVQRFQSTSPIPVPSRDPASIGRLVIQSLGGPAWWPNNSSSSSSSLADVEAAILAAVADLRLHIQDADCAAAITCPAGLYSESFQARLQHLADAVLCIQCLSDNSDVFRLLPDPISASALLEVRRLPALGLLRQRFIEERLYLIRHKRRSISIAVLDLLPLEALEGLAGQQQQQKAVDVPAVAKICGGGPGKPSVLDF